MTFHWLSSICVSLGRPGTELISLKLFRGCLHQPHWLETNCVDIMVECMEVLETTTNKLNQRFFFLDSYLRIVFPGIIMFWLDHILWSRSTHSWYACRLFLLLDVLSFVCAWRHICCSSMTGLCHECNDMWLFLIGQLFLSLQQTMEVVVCIPW